MTLPEDTVLVNRYRIDGLLAHGGMGAIYRAFDTNLNTPVAIKENFFQTPHRVAQFKQEALLLARLRHPALPRVIHHFSFEGQQYLVMDYIEGDNLWEIIRRRGGPLAEAEAVDYLIQVCQAVSYLHQQNPPIIHRDIKPQNIKITPQGKAVLVDFGIARQFEGHNSHTAAGAQGVTPGFSPPEQYSGEGTTPASDIYSLGATLYAVLTGKKPPNSVSLLAGSAKFEPPNLSNPNISQQTTQAIISAMQTQPHMRPQSVAEWQKRLEAIARSLPPGPEPVAGRPEPVLPRPAPILAGPPAEFWLVDQRGNGYPLRSTEPMWLGRHPEADIWIDDANVSRQHARIKVENGRCFVLDNHSANGTLLNNWRLSDQWTPIESGDVLIVGPARYYLTTTQPVKLAPPRPQTAEAPAVASTSTDTLVTRTRLKKSRRSGRLEMILLAILLLTLAGGGGLWWFNSGGLARFRAQPTAPAVVAVLPTPTESPSPSPSPTALSFPTVTPGPPITRTPTTTKADVLATPTRRLTSTPTPLAATATATPTRTSTPAASPVVARPQPAAGPTLMPLKSLESVAELGRREVIDVDINPKNPLEVYALVKRDGIYKSVTGGDGPWARVDLDGSGLTALTIDPGNPARLYAPTWNAVLKSTDGGSTWEAKTSGLVANRVVDLVTVHPANPNVLFAGVGEKLVVSTDQGETWTSQGYGEGLGAARLHAIVVDPFNPDTVLVAGLAAAIYKSTDGGRNFAPLPFNVGQGAFGLAAHPAQPGVYLAGINSIVAGIIKTDNAFDFRSVSDGLIYGGADSAYSAISYAPGNPAIVYAGSGLESEPDSKGMFKSSDGGENWQRINSGLAINPDTGYPHYVKSTAVHPTDPTIVFTATGSGLYKSSDGGQSWVLK